MSQISSGVGLVTGFPIATTVQKLIELDSGPVNNLTSQNTSLNNQSTAITALQRNSPRCRSAASPGGDQHLHLQHRQQL